MLHHTMLDARSIVAAAGKYLRQHPEEVPRALRQALALRLGVPGAALMWLVEQALGPNAAEDLEFVLEPPGVRVLARVTQEGAKFRLRTRVFVESVELAPDALRIEVRFEDVELVPLDGTRTALTALLLADALDLSRPGDLIQHLPGIPDIIVDAHANRLTLDLLRSPAVANNPRLRAAMASITPWVTIDRVESEADHVDLQLRPLPSGVMAAFDALRTQVVVPSLRRAHALLPASARDRLEIRVRQLAALLDGR